MKIYDWAIYGIGGEVEAEDIKDAMHQVVDKYFELPYPGDDLIRIDIFIKERR